MNSTLKCPYKH